MTLQHAKAIKIVLSLRCQKEIKYEKMNVHVTGNKLWGNECSSW